MAGSRRAALERRTGGDVLVVTASHETERSKRSLGLWGWNPSDRLISTRPLGSGNSDLRGLGGVLGPPVDGRDMSENVGDGVGGIGEYSLLVSLKVTCLTGIVHREWWW